MRRKIPVKLISLFLLFFFFQWGGQLAAAGAAKGGEKARIFLVFLYFCFLSRGFIWLFILRDIKLNLAYALSSIGYLIIPLLSLMVLGEPFQGNHLPGGILILCGVSLFGYAEQKRRTS